MEEEDEFGDLYTDVLSSFPASSAAPPPKHASNSDFTLEEVDSDAEEAPIKLKEEEEEEDDDEGVKEEEEEEDEGEDGDGDLAATIRMKKKDNSESSSDSEDDLQIVLNESDGVPEEGAEDLKPSLALVPDDPALPSEDPDWVPGSDDPSPSDPHSSAKPSSALPRPNFAPYHSFHSQFKYVRPGAPLLPPGSGAPPSQARPPLSIPLMAGRGRGDLRPPSIKGYWAGTAPPRGLDFTLPSHKTIFDIDFDNFEEKPWKYPGVDVSDFFNFSLNEDSWKDYCKQLEQLRLESTMQSKIRVYESGRAEQEFDPDLPPELAAAAAINESSVENADATKAVGGLGDPVKGATRSRPLVPTGRAIQVETGSGERLPSADTRPPRVRDSDAVIEIVLQGSVDDESAGNFGAANPDNDSGKEDDQVGVVNEDGCSGGDEDLDGYQQGGDVMQDVRESSSLVGSPHADVHNKERKIATPQRASSDLHSGSKDHDSTENVGSPYEKRWTNETARGRSSGECAHDRRSLGYQVEDDADSMDQKQIPESFSLARVGDGVEANVEGKSMEGNHVSAQNTSGKEKEDSDVVVSTDTSRKKQRVNYTEQPNVRILAEPSASKGVEDADDLEASRSSDTSKATGNSRDRRKWREGIDVEDQQNGRSTYMGGVKRHRGEAEHDSRRKDLDGRMDTERNLVAAKGREDYYSHKEWDPYTSNQGGDRRKQRDYSEARWQRQEEHPHVRRTRAEDIRRKDRGDEMISRQRRKASEIGKSDKDEYFQSQNSLENGSWKSYHEKDARLRYREKDGVLKSRREIMDDPHGQRRKDDDFTRRDHVDKQEFSLGLKESSSTRGKRDKEGSLNQRKRDDHPRVRDTYDSHHAVRPKDEGWVQRERTEPQRDKDEWYRAKQYCDENSSKMDRAVGHAPVRGSRAVEEKIWTGHSHGREEYNSHDKVAGRHGEQIKRRERVDEEISLQHRGSESVYAHGNQIVGEGKRPRQEKSGFRNDRAISASDNQKFHEEKLKNNLKNARAFEGHSTSGTSKRHQGEKGVAKDTADVKGLSKRATVEHDASLQNLSREVREGASSDDEHQDSKRGRSKLERWTSHKDRDRDMSSKSSSLKIKEMNKNRKLSGSTTVGGDESIKNNELEDSNQSLAAVKESGRGSEVRDEDAKSENCHHVDTFEKLERRKERFKLQLESEKEPSAMKKMENESIPSSQNETPVNAEVKQERPPRKRRWLSS
ncbi:hypothetical protein vseg_000003 [Gypsophila vaccaria]